MEADPDGIEDDDLEGVALFPEIPEELGIHPLTLATLQAIVFLNGSESSVVQRAAAGEVFDQMVRYLRRLKGADLRRIQEDLTTLTGFARMEKWPKADLQFLKSILAEIGLGS